LTKIRSEPISSLRLAIFGANKAKFSLSTPELFCLIWRPASYHRATSKKYGGLN
jgi:hypothetical protein